jgi:hypothetical protein
MKFLRRVLILVTPCMLALLAEEALTNESVLKLVKAGMSDNIVVGMVKSQPAKFSLGPDDIVALKKDGVSDSVIGAMLDKSMVGSASSVPAPAAAVAPAVVPVSPDPAKPPVTDIGVYYKKGDVWAELLPEAVNWKSGGFMKSVATAGMVKGDLNGNIKGKSSQNKIATPIEILIYAPEGVAVTEYQLLRLHEHSNNREFRTMTGGVFHTSGGASRDSMDFEGKKVASRTFMINLPKLQTGEYGFLPPGAQGSTHASGTLGKIYSFTIIE